MNSLDDLGKFFTSMLSECLDRGMPLPWLIACVAINGNMLLCRYVQDEDGDGLAAEMLCEPVGGAAFQLPINIMIVDATGDAARVLISQEGVTWH